MTPIIVPFWDQNEHLFSQVFKLYFNYILLLLFYILNGCLVATQGEVFCILLYMFLFKELCYWVILNNSFILHYSVKLMKPVLLYALTRMQFVLTTKLHTYLQTYDTPYIYIRKSYASLVMFGYFINGMEMHIYYIFYIFLDIYSLIYNHD